MQPARPKPLPGLLVALAFLALSRPIPGAADGVVGVTPLRPEVKCYPCNVPPPPQPPPLPPPVPSPPPPSPPPPPPMQSPPPPFCPPPPPPPLPKPPPPFCPPPPSPPSPECYPPYCPSPQQPANMVGPPGTLYPIDTSYRSAAPEGLVVCLPVLLGYGLFALLGF